MCAVVGEQRRFGETFCLHLQSWLKRVHYDDKVSRVSSWFYYIDGREKCGQLEPQEEWRLGGGGRDEEQYVLALPFAKITALKAQEWNKITQHLRNDNRARTVCWGRRDCPGPTLSTIYPTWKGLGSNLGLRGESLVTNRLRYGTNIRQGERWQKIWTLQSEQFTPWRPENWHLQYLLEQWLSGFWYCAPLYNVCVQQSLRDAFL